MRALYAPAQLNPTLRRSKWTTSTTIKESAFGNTTPQAHDIAAHAISKLRRHVKTGMKFWGSAYIQIAEQEITDCVKLHQSGLTRPPKYSYKITLTKDSDFISATIESTPEK